MFGGRAQDKSFGAVFGVGTALVRFVMDQCFHVNGGKRMPIVVMLFVRRYAHTPTSLDAPKIIEGGGVAVQPVGETDTIGGLAWKGLSS